MLSKGNEQLYQKYRTVSSSVGINFTQSCSLCALSANVSDSKPQPSEQGHRDSKSFTQLQEKLKKYRLCRWLF
jgi:hypothetical protein